MKPPLSDEERRILERAKRYWQAWFNDTEGHELGWHIDRIVQAEVAQAKAHAAALLSIVSELANAGLLTPAQEERWRTLR